MSCPGKLVPPTGSGYLFSMNYSTEVFPGRLIRRYKRFLADVTTEAGEKITVHCPNSGSMAGLTEEGNPVRYSGPHAPTRKYPFTLEQIQITRPDGEKVWVGVNTALPNYMTKEAIENGIIPGLEAYRKVRTEVKLNDHTRIDLFLEEDGLPPCWVEVKNVTLVLPDPKVKASLNEGDIAAFPDAVTTRGAKHLRELAERVQQGERAVMVYTIQRSDGKRFTPAVAFDPDYAKEWQRARDAGVEMIPMLTKVTQSGVELVRSLPIVKL